MTPSAEYYLGLTEGINNQGLPETASKTLLEWQKAQIPNKPYDFVIRADINGNLLWGILGSSVTVYGKGNIVFPISENGYDFEYPGLAWMIKENSKIVRDDSSADMYESIGLIQGKYGEWETSTGSPELRGAGTTLTFRRSPPNETGRAMAWRYPGEKKTDAQLVVSAMGLAETAQRDILNMTISPMPNVNLLNGQAPRVPSAVAA